MKNIDSTNQEINASIIIPIKNGGEIFKRVLSSLTIQKYKYPYEIILIDSGSKDGTLEFIQDVQKNYSNIVLHQIEPLEFGHGKTRNLGASLAKGEYLVFITQDALPVNEIWLQEMIKPFLQDENIVGVFGKHLPYDDCDIFEKHNLYAHFENFGHGIVVYRLEDPERYQKDERYRHLLGFYSDNASAMRKSIWIKYPYDDVDFAEDQLWAKKIIELGYSKAYNSEAIVYHSHNYPFREMLKRSYDDHKGLYKIYKYQPVKSIFLLPAFIVRHIINDIPYIRQQHIPKKEKYYWLYFSIMKNIMKYTGSYLGPIGAKHPSLNKLFSREFTLIRK